MESEDIYHVIKLDINSTHLNNPSTGTFSGYLNNEEDVLKQKIFNTNYGEMQSNDNHSLQESISSDLIEKNIFSQDYNRYNGENDNHENIIFSQSDVLNQTQDIQNYLTQSNCSIHTTEDSQIENIITQEESILSKKKLFKIQKIKKVKKETLKKLTIRKKQSDSKAARIILQEYLDFTNSRQ